MWLPAFDFSEHFAVAVLCRELTEVFLLSGDFPTEEFPVQSCIRPYEDHGTLHHRPTCLLRHIRYQHGVSWYQRAATVCCLWDFVSRYRAVEGELRYAPTRVLGGVRPALVKACNNSGDGVKSAPKSSALNGLRDFTTGTFENMTFSKVIDRGLIGMHGDKRAARILLHE
eukprot:3194039-Rhodomonas_salina.1